MKDCPALLCPFSTPKVYWYQNDASVTLRILLLDVEDYFLFVDQDHLRFSTRVNDRAYYLCLYLFGAIIPEKCTHRNVCREIRVNLPKAHKWSSWLRLCLEKTSNPSIIVDPEKVDESEMRMRRYLDRGWDDWQEYKRQNNITSIPPPPSSSDGSESDDEAMDALIDAFD